MFYGGGWQVGTTWIDRDGASERMWNRAVDPHGAERGCTTSQPQELLNGAGLDVVGDLALRRNRLV